MATRKKVIQQRDPLGRLLAEFTEEEEEDDGIIADGRSIRVPMWAMDGKPNPALDAIQRDVAQHGFKPLVTDGIDDRFGLHRPGFRYPADAAQRASADAALVEAYEARDLADREAWRSNNDHPLNTNARGQQQDAHTDDRALAYAEYDHEAENAWRK